MEELFLPRTDFENYQDFFENYKINVPDNFNFSYDVMDALAEKSPNARAILWTNDEGLQKEFTFKDIKERNKKPFFTMHRHHQRKGKAYVSDLCGGR